MEQLLQSTGQRDVPRRKSFSTTDWPNGDRFVRVEQDDVPILGAPDLNAPNLDVLGVASAGEIFAFIEQNRFTALVNPLSSTPDQSGLWYKVEMLEGKQGWVFADPVGHQGTPIATSFQMRNGASVQIPDESTQGQHTSTEAISNAQAQGAKAGYADGRKEGEATGFKDAVKAAENASYSQTLSTLYSSGQYYGIGHYNVLALFGGILLGFLIQYTVMFILRKYKLLYDIDRIVLLKHATEIDLNDVAVLPESSKREGNPSDHRLTLLLFALGLLSFVGCQDQEKEVYKKAYDSNYQTGYEDGRRAGEARGTLIGTDKGIAAAKEAAKNGTAWQLYSHLAIGGGILGALVGLLGQYIVLLSCRCSGYLPQLLTVAFVPAMKMSRSYFIFEQRQRLMLEAEEHFDRMCAAKNLSLAQMQTVHDVWRQRIRVTSSIEDLTRGRVVELFEKELDRIVSARQVKVNGLPAEAARPNATTCPFCKKTVHYKDHVGGKVAKCPNKQCGRLIQFPPLRAT